MRFVTYSASPSSDAKIGIIVGGDTVVDLKAALAGEIEIPEKLIDYVRAGKGLHDSVAKATAGRTEWPAGTSAPLSDVTLHAPLRPGKIVGVGLNYVEHVEESSRTLDTAKELPDRPVLFSKPGTAVIGPNQNIQLNSKMTQQLDWECELTVVMGKDAKNVSEANAYDYVFGYSIMNDISARDQRRSGQWFFSKGQDSYAPFGPMIVTTDELPDPHVVQLSLFVNDEQRQNGNAKFMLFKIPQLIADITTGVTLEAGDCIMTGSPEGVGAAMNPPTFLKPGDVVRCHIDAIGTLINPVVEVG